MLLSLFVLGSLLLGVLEACPSSCTCRSRYVDCANRHLPYIPTFTLSDRIGIDYDTLDLSNNDISTLTASSFANAPFTVINLNNNNITTGGIQNTAFSGAAGSLTELNLGGNKLTSLPSVIGTLNLTLLDVTNNPMVHSRDFTYSVMKGLGDTMRDFRFGSKQLEEWPTTLNHFQELQSMTVDGISSRLQVVPAEGFHGFETTLLSLYIRNTDLIAVPIGISKLKNLQKLHFDNNPLVTDRGVLVQSFPIYPGHDKLRELTMNRDGLTKFPAVIKYLRALNKLSLDENVLDFVNDVTLAGNVTVSELTLRDCKLDRVPGALSDILRLKSLDLSKNPIRTIEKNDLSGLHNLQHLIVANTSLEYISDDAFTQLHNLLSLNFTNSNVIQVPEAIRYISPCLRDLYLEKNKVECMCENLVWLKRLRDGCSANATPLSIHGDCDTIISTIHHYVDTYIPQCPAWKEENHLPPYNG